MSDVLGIPQGSRNVLIVTLDGPMTARGVEDTAYVIRRLRGVASVKRLAGGEVVDQRPRQHAGKVGAGSKPVSPDLVRRVLLAFFFPEGVPPRG